MKDPEAAQLFCCGCDIMVMMRMRVRIITVGRNTPLQELFMETLSKCWLKHYKRCFRKVLFSNFSILQFLQLSAQIHFL